MSTLHGSVKTINGLKKHLWWNKSLGWTQNVKPTTPTLERHSTKMHLRYRSIVCSILCFIELISSTGWKMVLMHVPFYVSFNRYHQPVEKWCWCIVNESIDVSPGTVWGPVQSPTIAMLHRQHFAHSEADWLAGRNCRFFPNTFYRLQAPLVMKWLND
jgi:hypothetical protein